MRSTNLIKNLKTDRFDWTDTIRRRVKRKVVRERLDTAYAELLLGTIIGSGTGERDRDPMGGGWEGTDDATSTAPSDLTGISSSPTGRPIDPNIQKVADELGNPSEMKEIKFPKGRPTKIYSGL